MPFRPEYRLAAPVPSLPERLSEPQTTHTGWSNQEQYKALAGIRRDSDASQRLAVLVEVVADFVLAHFPKGSDVSVAHAIAMLNSPELQAITVH